ncbi:MAG: TIM-barrel domain-containing protein [Xenococcus sp. (in: cyanobacteria)]
MTIFLTIQLPAKAEVFRQNFISNDGQNSLIVEIIDDDLVHFEYATSENASPSNQPFYTSPMVFKTDYSGPTEISLVNGNTIETKDLKLEIIDIENRSDLCLEFTDKTKQNVQLTRICPVNLSAGFKGIDIDSTQTRNVYGLGQQFKDEDGSADGDWISLGVRQGLSRRLGQQNGFELREPSSPGFQDVGNGFQGTRLRRLVGNVQIPVMYAVGSNNFNYALFADNVYFQRWDFNKPWWEARMYGDQLRFYLMAGADLPDLRADFMELTGKPPVPPKKALGLWVSEFGYDNWEQTDTLISSLREDNFPLDGFVVDLNWFGGIGTPIRDGGGNIIGRANSNMGRLDWDLDQDELLNNNFYDFQDDNPSTLDPDTTLIEYAEDDIRIAAIEESYLVEDSRIPTATDMPREFMAYDCNTNEPVTISANDFWGTGFMFDWSDPDIGQWINENRRFPNLVSKGINVHWTDLGEPERFEPTACYDGVETGKDRHPDIHNLYNLLWNKTIWDGYIETQDETTILGETKPRPFILTRSGAAGTQRYGAAMWSGDIASNLESLATHSNAQMHMSFSGIDYYGADIGGFGRETLPGNTKDGPFNTSYEEELYTQWFANGSWFDIPMRPHTDNEFSNNDGCQTNVGNRQPPCYETSPNLVGKVDSNLANLRQRYELLPYYYSLAYRAYLYGEPIVPPPIFYYQNDPNLFSAELSDGTSIARRPGLGNEKLIGKDILVGVVANHGEYERDIYLPPGKWINYNSNEWFESEGEIVSDVPVYRNGLFQLPAFVKAGAILPQMFVDDMTKDAFGRRKDGTERDELILQVYASPTATNFTLYEDDGKTITSYQGDRPLYHYRTTLLKQEQNGNTVTVTIDPAINIKEEEEVAEAFPDAVTSRANLIKLVVDNAAASSVTLNGITLIQYDNDADFAAANEGWFNAGDNLIMAKSQPVNVESETQTFSFELESTSPTTSVNFVCENGVTTFGNSIYAVGNINSLGNWNLANAVKLDPNIYYDYVTEPVWTGVIKDLPTNTDIEWKCINRNENDPTQVTWQSGDNNQITTANSGYSGHSLGGFF